jgi:glycosyltransferase involved in cell wall biosynthesis
MQMKILMLSDTETQGGAAIATSRLAEALCRAGHEVTRIVGSPDGASHTWQMRSIELSYSFRWRLLRGLTSSDGRRILNNWYFQSRLNRLLAEVQPEVISIHNLHGAGWAPDMVEICAKYAPAVWTLHDTWSFTGRCTCTYDCRKFVEGCDAFCPTPNEYPALHPQKISGAWSYRKQILDRHPNMPAVTPSRWMAQQASEGIWKGHAIKVIPNGLPLREYYPVDRTLARRALGISTDDPLLLVAAQNLSQRHKGAALLTQALQLLSGQKFSVATMGSHHEVYLQSGAPLFPLGYIDHERTRVLAYSAADILVHPSLSDNFPNVLIESIACGTPVVTFPIGGMPELARPGKTGWVAEQVSSEALATVLQRALNELASGSDLRVSCRTVAEAEFDAELQASRYLDVFQKLIAHRMVVQDETAVSQSPSAV